VTAPLQLTFTGNPVINIGVSAEDLAHIKTQLEQIVTALEDLQAADTALDAEIVALIAEQAQFLTDIAAKLGAAGVDPAALAAVSADLTSQAAQLQTLHDAQVAADPGPPAP